MSYLSGTMVLILADLSGIHKYKWLLDNPLQNLRVNQPIQMLATGRQ